jgi:hypothetical protein
MRRTVIGVAVVLLAAGVAQAGRQQTMRGGVALIKSGKLVRIVASPTVGNIEMANTGDDPSASGASLKVWDSLGSGGSDTYTLPAAGWRRMPKNESKPLKGFRYEGAARPDDPCTAVVLKGDVVKATCRGSGVTLTPPFAGNVKVALTLGDGRATLLLRLRGHEVKNQAQHPEAQDRAGAGPVRGDHDDDAGGGDDVDDARGRDHDDHARGRGDDDHDGGGRRDHQHHVRDGGRPPRRCSVTTPRRRASRVARRRPRRLAAVETTTTTIVGETTTTSIGGGETTTTTITGETDHHDDRRRRLLQRRGLRQLHELDRLRDCGDIIDSAAWW